MKRLMKPQTKGSCPSIPRRWRRLNFLCGVTKLKQTPQASPEPVAMCQNLHCVSGYKVSTAQSLCSGVY